LKNLQQKPSLKNHATQSSKKVADKPNLKSSSKKVAGKPNLKSSNVPNDASAKKHSAGARLWKWLSEMMLSKSMKKVADFIGNVASVVLDLRHIVVTAVSSIFGGNVLAVVTLIVSFLVGYFEYKFYETIDQYMPTFPDMFDWLMKKVCGVAPAAPSPPTKKTPTPEPPPTEKTDNRSRKRMGKTDNRPRKRKGKTDNRPRKRETRRIRRERVQPSSPPTSPPSPPTSPPTPLVSLQIQKEWIDYVWPGFICVITVVSGWFWLTWGSSPVLCFFLIFLGSIVCLCGFACCDKAWVKKNFRVDIKKQWKVLGLGCFVLAILVTMMIQLVFDAIKTVMIAVSVIVFLYTVSKNSTENTTDSNNQADPAQGGQQNTANSEEQARTASSEDQARTVDLDRFLNISDTEQRQIAQVMYGGALYTPRWHECSWEDDVICDNTEPNVMHIDKDGVILILNPESKDYQTIVHDPL